MLSDTNIIAQAIGVSIQHAAVNFIYGWEDWDDGLRIVKLARMSNGDEIPGPLSFALGIVWMMGVYFSHGNSSQKAVDRHH